jgi:hypothetical protein
VVGAVIMILGFITTLVVAGYMSSQNSHWVGGVPSDADGLPIVGWVRGGGDLRMPHFFATHLMQIIPLIGWMADRYSQRPTRIVIAASAIGVSAVAAKFIQALSGQPFILSAAPTPPSFLFFNDLPTKPDKGDFVISVVGGLSIAIDALRS